METHNTFNGGFNMDLSDFIIKSDTLRLCQNIRMLDLEGRTFATSNLPGLRKMIKSGDWQKSLILKPGYSPVAAKEYNGILYIISISITELIDGYAKFIELGTYPSPNYNEADINTDIWVYRPLNNLDNGPFNIEGLLNIKPNSYVDLELQPSYDDTVNLIIINEDNFPRIVNSGFSYIADTFKIINRQLASSFSSTFVNNNYTPIDIDKETRLILTSTKILQVEFLSIERGGILKPGNYHYIFVYATEGFNETDVVAQSSTCVVLKNEESTTYLEGGDSHEQTDKKVRLQLNNLDTTFKYLKVYIQYSTGQNSKYTQLLELNRPIDISGITSNQYIFEHLGYEDLTEVAPETINVDYSTIATAAVACQTKGYLMLGRIKKVEFDWEYYKILAKAVDVTITSHEVVGPKPYSNPRDVYYYLSEARAETAPYGVVFIMKNGVNSPVFPVTGKDFYNGTASSDMQELGLIRFSSHTNDISSGNNSRALGLKFDFSTLTSEQHDKMMEETAGFFIVRGTVHEDALAQGYIIPTFRAPIGKALAYKDGENYYDNTNYDIDTMFKFVPTLDGLVEANAWIDRGGKQNEPRHNRSVVGELNELSEGYMIASVPDNYIGKTDDSIGRVYDENYLKWAFYSADAILNEPEFITKLQRESLGLKQLGKILFAPSDNEEFQFLVPPLGSDLDPSSGYYIDWDDFSKQPGVTGLLYSFLDNNLYSTPHSTTLESTYVPAETEAPIKDFISKVWYVARHHLFDDDGHATNVNEDWSKMMYVAMSYNSYFGFNLGSIIDGIPDVDNPIGVQSVNPAATTFRNGRINVESHNNDKVTNQIDGNMYDNFGAGIQPVPAAFYVIVYSNSTGEPIADPSDMYTAVDSIVYKQQGKRFKWEDFTTYDDFQVFGGDRYIGRLTIKLNQVGPEFRNPLTPDTAVEKDVKQSRNINAGIMMEVAQETKYNPYARISYIFDNSELEDRTFYPFRNGNDPIAYRNYKYPDTTRSMIGSDEVSAPKTNFTLPSQAPNLKYNFFTRIAHSQQHSIGAFSNGYRIFEGVNYRDYDTSMGTIIRIVNHRDNVVVVFAHGLAILPIEQRMQTTSDELGGVFIEPTGVLPPHLGILSKEVGSQHPYSVLKTPGAVYGVDINKHKIWKIEESLKVISDDGFQSFLQQNMNPEAYIKNISIGYDSQHHEVLITYVEYSDDNFTLENTWTLVYKEGLEKFTSFYTIYPKFYARRNDEFYSFGNFKQPNPNTNINQAFLHNNYDSNLIYGNLEESFVEFVINENPNITKVVDYINIVSNEVAPIKIEFFTYQKNPKKEFIIAKDKTYQYILVDGTEVNMFTGESVIKLRDKKYVVQVPTVQELHNEDSKNMLTDWAIKGRLRNKAIIIRLTYLTEDRVELLSVLTSYRNSIS